MNLTPKQINLLNRRKIVVLATSSLKAEPRAILVEVNQAKDDQIIITDNGMGISKNNLLKNKKLALLAFEEDYGYCLKIIGEAEYYTEGEHFDFVKNLETNKDQNPKGVMVIAIKEAVEFE